MRTYVDVHVNVPLRQFRKGNKLFDAAVDMTKCITDSHRNLIGNIPTSQNAAI